MSDVIIGGNNEKLISDEILRLRELIKLLPKLRMVVEDYEAGELNNVIRSLVVIDGRIVECNGNRSKFSDSAEEEKYNGVVNSGRTAAPATPGEEGSGSSE